jgi:hypothetical protein
MKRIAVLTFLCLLSLDIPAQAAKDGFIPFQGLKELSVSGNIKVVLITGQREGMEFDKGVENPQAVSRIFSKGRLILAKDPGSPDEKKLIIYVYFKTMSKVFTSGNSMLVTLSRIEQYMINIYATGNSTVQLDLNISKLKAELDGQAVVTVRGRGIQETINTDGLSKFVANDFICETAFVRAESDSEVNVYVDKELRTNGSPNIHYIGNPASVDGDNSNRY